MMICRDYRNLVLTFSKGLNVIIAKNNCGKSAVIDALRLSFSYGSYPREIYAVPSDFHIDKTNPEAKIEDILIDLHFSVNTELKYGIFNDLLAVDENGNQELQLHLQYSLVEHQGVTRVRPKVWGGANEGQQVAQEVLELFYHIFLGALRDASREMRPVSMPPLEDRKCNVIQQPHASRKSAAERQPIMPMNYEELDDKTRALMLKRFV
jgi:putative ATP-dependent endonuclease of OLD family